MVWTREPSYEKPEISVRATTLYYQIVAPIMLPFLERRILNLYRCREGKCFFQRNREHPPTGKEFDKLVHLSLPAPGSRPSNSTAGEAVQSRLRHPIGWSLISIPTRASDSKG